MVSFHILLHLSFSDSTNVYASRVFLEEYILIHVNICVCLCVYMDSHAYMDITNQKLLNPLNAYT